jgi:hypothetical protein
MKMGPNARLRALATFLGVAGLAIAAAASAQHVHVCRNAAIAGQHGCQDSRSSAVDGTSFRSDAVRTPQFRVVVRGGNEILTLDTEEGRNHMGKYRRMVAY